MPPDADMGDATMVPQWRPNADMGDATNRGADIDEAHEDDEDVYKVLELEFLDKHTSAKAWGGAKVDTPAMHLIPNYEASFVGGGG